MITTRRMPDLVTGGILPPSDINIIVPEATVNIAGNPSAETNLTNWGMIGSGSLSRSAAQQWAGVYSVLATGLGANSGVSLFIDNAAHIVSGRVYTASMWFLGQAGKYYRIRAAFTSVFLSPPILSYGIWQRASYTFVGDANQFASVGMVQVATGGNNRFYLDALQLENKAYPTTYCDGDMSGFVPGRADYTWDGTPHASSSRRNALTRSGGRPMNIRQFFLLSVLAGLGIGGTFETATTQLHNGGEYAQRTIPRARFCSLAGIVPGDDPQHTRENAAALSSALNPFRFADNQPLVMTYQELDADDGTTPTMPECKMIAYPTPNSMAGNAEAPAGMTQTLEFKMMLPYILRQGDGGAALTLQDSISSTAMLLRRDPATGDWSGITASDVEPLVYAIAKRPAGGVYFAGQFTNAGGVSGATNIAYYDGANVVNMSTGANGAVYALAVAPNGNLIAAGAFTTIGGVAANRIALWNGTGWSALGTGLNDTVLAVDFGTDGSILYVGGQFTTAGSIAQNRIARYSFATSTWSGFGTGANGNVTTIKRQTYGRIYIGGAFTTINGITLNRIGYYDGSTFQPMGTGTDGIVNDIATLPNGNVYILGAFTTAGGITAPAAAQWRGNQWESMGGTPTGGNPMDSSGAYKNGIIMGVQFGLNELPDSQTYVLWTGTGFVYGEMASRKALHAVFTTDDGALYLGVGAGSGGNVAALMAGSTLLSNPGTAPAYPTFKIYGPSGTTAKRIYQIVNVTNNGVGLYFDLDVNPGEVITVSLDPFNIRVVSSWRGELPGVVLTSSNPAQWLLNPGDNYISALAEDNSMVVTAQFSVGYGAIDDAIIRLGR